MSSMATELVSVSGKEGGPLARRGTRNHASEDRATEATDPAKGVPVATAEAIPAARAATDPVRDLAEAVGASAGGSDTKFKLQTLKFKVTSSELQGGRV